MGTETAKIEANLQEFIIDRKFASAREKVWQALVEPKRIEQWFAPKGFTSRATKMDLRPGGTYHYGMSSLDGHEMWGKMVYREIVAPERLVYIHSFSDANGATTRHPMSQTWPLEMLTTFILVDYKNETTLIIKWTPFNALEEEKLTFAASHDSMRQGWTGTLDNLTEYLSKNKSKLKRTHAENHSFPVVQRQGRRSGQVLLFHFQEFENPEVEPKREKSLGRHVSD